MGKRVKYFLIALVLTILMLLIIAMFFDNKAILRHEAKNIGSKINQTICIDNEYIECTSTFYYEESEQIKLYFNFENYGNAEDSELEGMCRVADYVSEYVKNNPKSILYGEKITLGSECCCRLGDIKICNFDPATNESFSSSEQFNYGYFDGYFYNKEDFSLSKLEQFDWFEILEFSDMTNDDYSILLDFPQLKEIRCESDFFTETEQDILRSKGVFISFKET